MSHPSDRPDDAARLEAIRYALPAVGSWFLNTDDVRWLLATVDALTATVARRDWELNISQQAYVDTRIKLDEAATHQGARVAELEATVRERDATIAKAEAAMAEDGARISDAARRNAALVFRVGGLLATVRERDQWVGTLKADCLRYMERIDEYKAKVAALELDKVRLADESETA